MPRQISKKYSVKELKFLEAAKRMPPLYHTLPNEEFDINKSEVIKWLMNQEDTKQFICDRIMNRSKVLKPIEYNSKTGKWQGVEYDKED